MKREPRDSPLPSACQKCKSGYIHPMTDKSAVGTWKKVSRSWHCAKCQHEWPASEKEQS